MPVAMNAFFAANAITTKAHLDTCGRAALYEYVKAHAPAHWARIKSPEQYIQGYYQRVLEGYKNYKAPREAAVAIAEPPSTVAEDDSFLAEMEALLSSPAIPAPVFTAARVDEKVSAKAAAAAAKAAAKAAKAAAKAAAEVAEPTPYDGLHIVNGILYMVDEKTNNVFAYDAATETVGDRVGVLSDGIIDYAEPLSVEPLTAPGTVVATVVEPPVATVAQAKATASDVKRAATKEAKAVILRAQIARLEEQLARRQAELAAL